MISRSRLLDRSHPESGINCFVGDYGLSPSSIARITRQVERKALPVDPKLRVFHHPLTTKAELADLLLIISALSASIGHAPLLDPIGWGCWWAGPCAENGNR